MLSNAHKNGIISHLHISYTNSQIHHIEQFNQEQHIVLKNQTACPLVSDDK